MEYIIGGCKLKKAMDTDRTNCGHPLLSGIIDTDQDKVDWLTGKSMLENV